MPVQCPSRTCRSRRWNSGQDMETSLAETGLRYYEPLEAHADWSYGGVKRLAYPGEREKE
jgi:hypothetical protein